MNRKLARFIDITVPTTYPGGALALPALLSSSLGSAARH